MPCKHCCFETRSKVSMTTDPTPRGCLYRCLNFLPFWCYHNTLVTPLFLLWIVVVFIKRTVYSCSYRNTLQRYVATRLSWRFSLIGRWFNFWEALRRQTLASNTTSSTSINLSSMLDEALHHSKTFLRNFLMVMLSFSTTTANLSLSFQFLL